MSAVWNLPQIPHSSDRMGFSYKHTFSSSDMILCPVNLEKSGRWTSGYACEGLSFKNFYTHGCFDYIVRLCTTCGYRWRQKEALRCPGTGISDGYKATMWVLKIKLKCSWKAAGALSCWAVSPAPWRSILIRLIAVRSVVLCCYWFLKKKKSYHYYHYWEGRLTM